MNTNKTHEFICIVCPQGCRLTVTEVDGEYNVSGNACKRGIAYGVNELTAPTRMVTSTVALLNSNNTRLIPVKTSAPIPKDMIFDCMNEINKAKIKAPVKVGDIVIANVLGTDANIVVTKTMD